MNDGAGRDTNEAVVRGKSDKDTARGNVGTGSKKKGTVRVKDTDRTKGARCVLSDNDGDARGVGRDVDE